MDFSKAFDSVNHSLLRAKLKQLPLNPYIQTGTTVFCMNDNSVFHLVTMFVLGRQSTRERVREVLAALVFLNDLNIFHNDVPVLFKYADDSTILAPVSSNSDQSDRLVELFLNSGLERII